jgi:hypothetical protein
VRRRQFEAYLKKVFHFPALVAQVPEGRRCPQHPCHKVFEALLLGAAMQLPSIHQLEQACRDGALAHRIGPISEDTFRYALQRLVPEAIFAVGCQIAKRLKRNGVLRTGWARGRVVADIDGIEICASFVRCCDACLERRVQRKVGDVWVEVTQYIS